MSRKNDIEDLAIRLLHAAPPEDENMRATLLNKLEAYSARALRILRRACDAFWEAHDESLEKARLFFEFCLGIYDDLDLRPAKSIPFIA